MSRENNTMINRIISEIISGKKYLKFNVKPVFEKFMDNKIKNNIEKNIIEKNA